MRKYFLRIILLFLLLFLFKEKVFADVILLWPPNGFNSPEDKITAEWENTDSSQPYLYKFQFSDSPYFRVTVSTSPKEEIFSHTRTFIKFQLIYWRIAYHPLSTWQNIFQYYSDIGVFAVNKKVSEEEIEEVLEINRKNKKVEEQEEEEEEISSEEDVLIDIEEEKEEEEKSEEVVQPILEEGEIVVQRASYEGSTVETVTLYKPAVENILSPEGFLWNVKSSTGDVLGVKTSNAEDVVCKFDFLKNRYETIYCNIPKLKILKEQHYHFGDEYSLQVEANQKTSFNIQVDEYVCDFHLLKPKTWFKCEKRLVKSNILSVFPNISLRILYDDSKLLPILSFSSQGDHFLLSAGNYKDPKRRVVLIHTYRIVGREFGVLHEEKNSYLLSPKVLNNITNTEKPFSFPFERLIGVTQWYGNTAFQTPHTGIDFGAREENVLAVEKGEIVAKGWDSYFGECNSGGNYLRVKQENGMNTVYFHLAESYVNTGDMVKKGDIIAKSGNSGAWNCQPLGYHLHFETRLNQNMNSHDNPVKYINADWDSVPTLNYKQIPGRLTGENPHPGR